MLDTTIRPVCFGISPNVNGSVAVNVGPEKFRRYEYILYLMAQLSRIVYCDSGIMWYVIQSSLGLSNDVVNKVITVYDRAFLKQRRQPITSQPGDRAGRPMESYSLRPGTGKGRYASYISTPDDMTCLFLNAGRVQANPNSILRGQDLIVAFKGSSTAANFKHDLMSQFTASDLGGLVAGLGIQVAGEKNYVTGSFVKPLVKAWHVLVRALSTHVTVPGTRLFLTGHSLGGAYCSLFGFILAEAKISGAAYMQNITSIHIISFGAPAILGDNARNTFNRHLKSGFITLDRVVSQKVAARSGATQILVGGPAGPNNVIPTIPAGFSHPGYRPLATEYRPEANGRPYSIDNIRRFYGVASKTRYRDAATWPFIESVMLGDRAQRHVLAQHVARVTHVKGAEQIAEAEDVDVMPAELAVRIVAGTENDPTNPVQSGGLGLSQAKRFYDMETKTMLPNFVSIAPSIYAYGFAHGEYLGMFFMGGFRMAGMKNPAATSIAYFTLGADGVKTDYLPTNGGKRRNTSRKIRGRWHGGSK